MELLKRDVLRGSDSQDCFVLTLNDEAECQRPKSTSCSGSQSTAFRILCGVTRTRCTSPRSR
jgi:hypothetical protein